MAWCQETQAAARQLTPQIFRERHHGGFERVNNVRSQLTRGGEVKAKPMQFLDATIGGVERIERLFEMRVRGREQAVDPIDDYPRLCRAPLPFCQCLGLLRSGYMPFRF